MPDQLYKDNLSLLARFVDPEVLNAIDAVKVGRVSRCSATNGMPNLYQHFEGLSYFLHSQENPEEEARRWFDSLYLKNTKVLFVFGTGLGYYYDAAKQWLREDVSRHVVFFEDDPEVMQLLLQTKRANEILKDSQASLSFVVNYNSEIIFQKALEPYLFYPSTFTGLESYLKNRYNSFILVKSKLTYFKSIALPSLSELLNLGRVYYDNFYHNTMLIPHVYSGGSLKGKFKNTPAIIVGAGPSLNKNIDLLATLTDRALIFAGGTALNVLNANGVYPHFGVGLDPNPAQYSRLIMNSAFETYFMYRNRMMHEALSVVHGDKLMMTGAAGYKIAAWVGEKLGIKESEIEEGFNVLNFSTSIASMMGCSPIICVGVDLAYSEGESYAKGLKAHPIFDPELHFITKHPNEELLSKKDIFGNPVMTTWKWLAESEWYTSFSIKNPDVVLINATEGGIGFDRVKNMTLQEVANTFLQQPFDSFSLLHGEIQNSPMPSQATDEKVMQILDQIKKDAGDCVDICHDFFEQLKKMHEEVQEGVVTEERIKEESHHYHDKLESNEIYDPIIEDFVFTHQTVYRLESINLERQNLPKNSSESLEGQISIEAKECQFLYAAAEKQVELIEAVEQLYKSNLAAPSSEIKHDVPAPSSSDTYQYENEMLLIKDRELAIDYEKPFIPDKVEKRFYPNGAVSSVQMYKNGQLHGPSYFYSNNGNLLASAWFLDGKREGKSWRYYLDGHLHSLLRFKNHLAEGQHLYFYKSGMPKSILTYVGGKLDGEVALFYPKGQMKRRLYFKNGKRFGKEEMWNLQGKLVLEAFYEEDRPLGTAKKWYDSGVLHIQQIYDKNHQLVESLSWDQTGKLLPPEKDKPKDYYDYIELQMNQMTSSIEKVAQNVTDMIPEMGHRSKQPMKSEESSENLKVLKEELIHLNKIYEDFKNQKKLLNEAFPEPLWKNPETQLKMNEQIEKIHDQLSEQIHQIQLGLQEIEKKIKEAEKSKEPPTQQDDS